MLGSIDPSITHYFLCLIYFFSTCPNLLTNIFFVDFVIKKLLKVKFIIVNFLVFILYMILKHIGVLGVNHMQNQFLIIIKQHVVIVVKIYMAVRHHISIMLCMTPSGTQSESPWGHTMTQKLCQFSKKIIKKILNMNQI